MNKAALLLSVLFVGTVVCTTCSQQKVITKTIPTSPDNVFTLSVLTSITSNVRNSKLVISNWKDVVIWKRSSTEDITIEATVYSDFTDELDSVLYNTTLTGNLLEVSFSSIFVLPTTSGSTDSSTTNAPSASTTAGTETEISQARSIPLATFVCSLIALSSTLAIQKNNFSFNFGTKNKKNALVLIFSVLLIAILCIFQYVPTSFAPCPSSSVIRIYVPDTVKSVCDNNKCFSNCAVSGLGVNIHFTNPKGIQ
jgi:hypothetical protein